MMTNTTRNAVIAIILAIIVLMMSLVLAVEIRKNKEAAIYGNEINLTVHSREELNGIIIDGETVNIVIDEEAE